jgi:hypothetical protein
MFYTTKIADDLNERLLTIVHNLNVRIDELEATIPTAIKQAIEAHELSKEVRVQRAADERHASDVPFVEVISSGYDPELGVQMQLDWNAAFIKELKGKGYRGRSERDIVNKWLVATHKQLAEQFEQGDKV